MSRGRGEGRVLVAVDYRPIQGESQYSLSVNATLHEVHH